MGVRALAVVLLVACGGERDEAVVVHSPALAFGTELAATDLAAELSAIMDVVVVRSIGLPTPCIDGELHIAVLGHEHDDSGQRQATELPANDYEIIEYRCGDGRRVTLRAGSHLASQWAIYDLLQRLGVRYLEPEQTLYPEALRWPRAPFAVRVSGEPRAQPIAPSPPGGSDAALRERRRIDWSVKLRRTTVDGIDEAVVGSYAYDRGFPR